MGFSSGFRFSHLLYLPGLCSKSDLKPWSVFGAPLILYQWRASWCGFSNQHLFFWLPAGVDSMGGCGGGCSQWWWWLWVGMGGSWVFLVVKVYSKKGGKFLRNKFPNSSDHFLGLGKHRKSILRINSQNKLIKHRLHTTLQGFLMGWPKCSFSTTFSPVFSFLGWGWGLGCYRVYSYVVPSWFMHVNYKNGHPTTTLYTSRNQWFC